MPSIKDQSTVNAIAQEFTSNGRNKTQAMLTIGYDDEYADSGVGQKSVYGNVRVIAAIKAIDDKIEQKYDSSRESLISKLMDIINKTTSTAKEITSAASLIGDFMGHKRDLAPNKAKEQAILARMSSEDKELALIASRVRTELEARKGLKIAN